MAKYERVRIRDNLGTDVHFIGDGLPQGSELTLCGTDALSYDIPAEDHVVLGKTQHPVTCEQCLAIVKFCKIIKLKRSEVKQ